MERPTVLNLPSASNFCGLSTSLRNWFKLAFKSAASVVVISTSVALHAAELDLNVAQALIAEGKAQQAFDMLAPFEDEFAGELQFDYLLARSALESGKPSLASFIYERILVVEPNYVGVRLENGRAYMEMQNFARAKQEFDLVLRFDNLPPDLRSTAEEYARIVSEQLEPKKFFYNLFAEYTFGIDDNVTGLQSSSLIDIPGGTTVVQPDDSVKQEDFFHALRLGGQAIYQVTDNWQLHGGADYSGRFHENNRTLDSHDAELRTGFGYVTRNSNLRLLGRAGHLYQDDDHTRKTLGVSADFLYALDERNQLSATLSYTDFRFIGEANQVNDFDAYNTSIGLNHAFWDGKALLGVTLIGGYENEEGGRLDGNKLFAGANVSVQASFTDTLGGFLVASAQRDQYKKANAVFLRRRHDNLYTATGGLTWRFAENLSLRPQVGWLYSDSNIQTSGYDQLRRFADVQGRYLSMK